MVKKTTIEDLAGMVKIGFDETTENMEGLKKEMRAEFRLVDGRLDVIESEIMDIRKKLDNIIYRHEFEIIKDRLANLEKRVTTLKGR